MRYEEAVKHLPADRRGFIDVFMPGTLIVEQKSAGRDLVAAEAQAMEYFDWLPEVQRPTYILTCDFQRWNLLDMTSGQRWAFRLHELKDHVTAFAFIVGAPVREQRNQEPANEAASKLLGALHENLAERNYTGHQLELLLVRLLFMLFADDTGIWPKDQLLTLLEQRTQADGRDLGDWLTRLFQVLDTPDERRQTGEDDDLLAFPHVNGPLFKDRIDTAAFDNATRDILINASEFNWGRVSPAIFGSLFESVIDKVTRREQGAHYTPEVAIQRVIGPLFLDDLTAELDRIVVDKSGNRTVRLERFHAKLASLTFLDPACGAGNFLVVAYRELRELERRVLCELHPPGERQLFTDIDLLSKVNVNQFYGIEVDEFPSQIAQVALWMTDHIANVRLGEDFGRAFSRIPLKATPTIVHGDALEVDWEDVLSAERCSYVLGNPPFSGSKPQGPDKSAQVRRVARLAKGGGTLDYVAAWFLLAARYAAAGGARVGFVATNSVCQGEQVAQLWPKVWEAGVEIAFGHQTFVWPGRAAVHCVIVGLTPRGSEPTTKRLFSYPSQKGEPVESAVAKLSAYLADPLSTDPYLVVAKEHRPINGAPRVVIGSKPIDGGYLIFDANERAELLAAEPGAAEFLHPYLGAQEYLNGGGRHILALQQAPPAKVRALPKVRERLRKVTAYREGTINAKGKEGDRKEPGSSSLALAKTPAAYHVTVIPNEPFLVIPENSSIEREYIPLDWLEPPVIPSNKLRLLPKATPWQFGVLTSQMHMAWTRQIGGRLKSDYQYGIGLNYNTFPWPDATPAQSAAVEALAQAVLDARAMEKNATSTLADLYDPDTMPAELRRAHAALDAAVDRLYRRAGFASDAERVEHLFARYQALIQPTADAPRRNTRTKRRVGRAATA